MKGPGRLFWKLFLGSVLLATLVLAICAWLVVQQTDEFTHDALTQHLLGQAFLLSEIVTDRLDPQHADELDRLAKSVARHSPHPIRITFILADGRVVGDSLAATAQMESHSGRREVVEALARGWGEDVHLSHTLTTHMHYLAVRVGSADAPRGVVRVAMSTEAIGARAKVIRSLIWRIFLVGLLALVVFAVGLARLWSRPIKQMTRTARSLSQGDLSARVHVRGSDEVAELGRSLNDMRDHLADQLETIDRQRRILESLLAQSLEGIVLVDPEGRIVLINPAAVRLMGLDDREHRSALTFERMHVHEFISDPKLRRMLLGHQSPTDPNPVQEDRIRVQTAEGETSVLARASDIRLPRSGAAEATSSVARLLVLTDVSELARAMQVKTDFAANASHELRTPLAAILGAVETLLQMDLAANAVPAGQFLQMIHRHAARMQAMVADLLDLSRLESSPDQFKPQRLAIRNELSELETRHAEHLEAKGLRWEAQIEPGVETLSANAHLLRLALDNLVDNAIKFTEPGGRVGVSVRQAAAANGAGRSIAIEVADTGCGIPPEHQSRVFERFYQVEAARSGSLRGTGLGLSIVRHAVAAMHGRVDLRSTPGQGTTVTVELKDD